MIENQIKSYFENEKRYKRFYCFNLQKTRHLAVITIELKKWPQEAQNAQKFFTYQANMFFFFVSFAPFVAKTRTIEPCLWGRSPKGGVPNPRPWTFERLNLSNTQLTTHN